MAQPLHRSEATWIELNEVDSTNAEAMRRAVKGEAGPLYIRADRQCAGRGRLGRVWQTPEGNLALSRLGRVACPAGSVPQLSLVAGIAVYEAAAWALAETDHLGLLQLKWPNDVLLGGAKLAGILVEATRVNGHLVTVIGIGVNLVHAPEIVGRRTAALASLATRSVSPSAFAGLLAQRLEGELAIWEEGLGFDAVRAAWLSRSAPLNTAMTIETSHGRIAGSFGGLDKDGAMILRDDQGRAQRYTFGDVTLASEREMS